MYSRQGEGPYYSGGGGQDRARTAYAPSERSNYAPSERPANNAPYQSNNNNYQNNAWRAGGESNYSRYPNSSGGMAYANQDSQRYPVQPAPSSGNYQERPGDVMGNRTLNNNYQEASHSNYARKRVPSVESFRSAVPSPFMGSQAGRAPPANYAASEYSVRNPDRYTRQPLPQEPKYSRPAVQERPGYHMDRSAAGNGYGQQNYPPSYNRPASAAIPERNYEPIYPSSGHDRNYQNNYPSNASNAGFGSYPMQSRPSSRISAAPLYHNPPPHVNTNAEHYEGYPEDRYERPYNQDSHNTHIQRLPSTTVRNDYDRDGGYGAPKHVSKPRDANGITPSNISPIEERMEQQQPRVYKSKSNASLKPQQNPYQPYQPDRETDFNQPDTQPLPESLQSHSKHMETLLVHARNSSSQKDSAKNGSVSVEMLNMQGLEVKDSASPIVANAATSPATQMPPTVYKSVAELCSLVQKVGQTVLNRTTNMDVEEWNTVVAHIDHQLQIALEIQPYFEFNKTQ